MTRASLLALVVVLVGCTRTDQASIPKMINVWSCDDVAEKHCRWVDKKKEWPWVFDKEHWEPNCNGAPMPPETLAAYKNGNPWSCDPSITISTTPPPPVPNFSGVSLTPNASAGRQVGGRSRAHQTETGTTTSNPPWISAFRVDRDCAPSTMLCFAAGMRGFARRRRHHDD